MLISREIKYQIIWDHSMKISYILIFILFIQINHTFSQSYKDEIIFHSSSSTFAPLITIEGDAQILWTFDDGTTSTAVNPVKHYGSEGLRKNTLKVTPWSAVIGINIGYDASDGGSTSIPFVSSIKASKVENLELVAPSLKLWCSSYSLLDTMIFDNFINLETIESYLALYLKHISLKNTPKLKRINVEDNNLQSLDLSECVSLEDLRGSLNAFEEIIFPVGSLIKAWHLCARDNPQITNPYLYSDLSNFNYISELLIWNSSQKGKLKINYTLSDSVYIDASKNNYSSIDFTGSLQNENGWAKINLRENEITSINLAGCSQIKYLNLYINNLSSDSVDKVLKQLDEFGTTNGFVDLRGNAHPTSFGFSYAKNLEEKGWIVYTANYSKIRVFGNSNEIFDGDVNPSQTNWSDFGSVAVDADSVIHTFTIKNVGSTDLRLLGIIHLLDQSNPWIPPYIGITGTNASDFKVISEPSGTIAPGDSTVFQISFNPSGLGTRTAKVYFPNSDWSKAPFDFVIQGEGVEVTSVEEENSDENKIPDKFGLLQNYPNPFNPSTRIQYQVSGISQVTLKVYNILGNEIATLVDEYKPAGTYVVNFNAANLPSGMYFYRLQAGNFAETKQMLLLK